jgi:uncharacterized protein with HEPN domain
VKHSAAQIAYFARRRIARIIRATENDTLETYIENEERKDAVERNFIAIGEALKDLARVARLADLDPSGPWSEPAQFRDILAHNYDDKISHYSVFETIRKRLPELDAALARIEPLVGGPYDPDADDLG